MSGNYACLYLKRVFLAERDRLRGRLCIVGAEGDCSGYMTAVSAQSGGSALTIVGGFPEYPLLSGGHGI